MKFKLIFKREFSTRIRSKWFKISTVLMPLMLLILTGLPHFLIQFQTDDIKEILVVDQTHVLVDQFIKSIETEKSIKIIAFNNKEVPSKDSLLKITREKDYFGVIIIPADVKTSSKFDFYCKNPSNFTLMRTIRQTLANNISELRIKESDYDPSIINQLTQYVHMEGYKIADDGQVKEEKGESFFLAYIIGFALYMSLLLYGSLVANSIIEEKNSRVYEIILSSVKPIEILTGKIIGICAVGVTQFLIWIVLGGIVLKQGNKMFDQSNMLTNILSNISDTPLGIWMFFLFYFIVGFLTFASLFAVVGSVVNDQTEAQQFQTPLIIFIIIIFMLMFFVINNPETPISTVLSILPLTAPMLMMVRMAIQSPPIYQIILSMVFQLLGFFGMIYISAKIYRIGILMYGKPPSFKELIKWYKQS